MQTHKSHRGEILKKYIVKIVYLNGDTYTRYQLTKKKALEMMSEYMKLKLRELKLCQH